MSRSDWLEEEDNNPSAMAEYLSGDVDELDEDWDEEDDWDDEEDWEDQEEEEGWDEEEDEFL